MAIYHCRKLTIAAVNGHAVRIFVRGFESETNASSKAGVGCTALQLPFDIRFAWKDAKIIFPFIRHGIVPEGRVNHFLIHSPT